MLWLGLVLSIVLCFAASGIGSLFTAASVSTWYQALERPAWNPPDWVFGPVWSALYLSMAIAARLVWRRRERTARPLLIFGVQLFLNVLWSALFFGLRSPGTAFVGILLLWAAILATIQAFARISRPAGWLLIPYLLWVTFAAALNFSIWRLNP
ncbi:MAG: tryptophan-rich sensory protein [bacterium]|nr:tryptophan-rich sensory protein [bacterium]